MSKKDLPQLICRFEVDGIPEFREVTRIDFEDGNIEFKREDGVVYNFHFGIPGTALYMRIA